MASCYICGTNIDKPQIDPRDNKLKPCSTCEQVVQDCLDKWEREGDDGYFYLDTSPDEIPQYHTDHSMEDFD